MALLGWATHQLLRRRLPQLHHHLHHPAAAQGQQLQRILHHAAHTRFAQEHGLRRGMTLDQFRAQVPIRTYDELLPWISLMLRGEPDVLWPGRAAWFSRSSGTTQQRSKLIPVPQESLAWNHFAAGRDMGALYLQARPGSRLMHGMGVSVGGSHEVVQMEHGIRAGDLSAVIIQNLPAWYARWRTPSREVALLADWDAKLVRMATEIARQRVTNLHGVPSWTLVLLHRMMELHPQDTLATLWPQWEVFFHGGVSFAPYQQEFQRLTAGLGTWLWQTYNASEGFFAVQDRAHADDMALLVAHGIHYEFVPQEEWGQAQPRTLTVREVEQGSTYALVITTCGGLWRYALGDTVTVTSTAPLRIRVAGRVQQFLNAFGEEVMVAQAEAALAEACAGHHCQVRDFMVCAERGEGRPSGWHLWAVEFAQAPQDLAAFSADLDAALRRINSDYDAKRQGDWVMGPAVVKVVSAGTFERWLRGRGQLGGQHKVPRLVGDSAVVWGVVGLTSPT